MHLQQESDSRRLRIKSYTAGEICINDDVYNATLLLTADNATAFTAAEKFDALTFEMLQPIVELTPEVLVIGCGENFQLMPLSLQRELEAAGIAVETMATREACHTYEVLSHELREVVALLFL